ncbi:MAG: ASKHA domain-containing protein, partial [Methanomassiliicoccales archaeon]
ILEDTQGAITLDPDIKLHSLTVPEASLDYQVGDFDRILSMLGETGKEPYYTSLKYLRKVTPLLKETNEIFVATKDWEILDVTPITESCAYGVAVDIGTTTVVAYLMDLISGECKAISSEMNPQIRYGDDVLSRVTFSMHNSEKGQLLQSSIVDCLNRLIENCCKEAHVPEDRIYEVAVVGNTAMHHFFYGLDASNLGRSPYVPSIARALEVKAREVGLHSHPEAYCYSLPNVAGFVGADHTSVLLSTRLWEAEEPQIAIDIGTNGEISVGSKDGIASTSCAAGPALEGATIKFGMRGASGAIDHLTIDKDWNVEYTTIGNRKARGLCGSAIVDAIAEMFKAGVLEPSGRIRKEIDSPRIIESDGEVQFIIAYEEEASLDEPVVITQGDVGEVQCAKAALYSGVTMLMDIMDIKLEEVDKLFLAGAFGNYISPESSMNLGLIPEMPLDKVKGIGNAAGDGAKIALLNKTGKREVEEVVKNLHYVELALLPEFDRHYCDSMFLPHRDTSLFPRLMSQAQNFD